MFPRCRTIFIVSSFKNSYLKQRMIMHVTMLMEEKERILDLFEEFVNYMNAYEKASFQPLTEILGYELTHDEIREALLRDLQRQLVLRSDDSFNRLRDDYEKSDQYLYTKSRIINQITSLCPELTIIFERFEYSLWSANKIERALPEEIMLSSDWEHVFYAMIALIT